MAGDRARRACASARSGETFDSLLQLGLLTVDWGGFVLSSRVFAFFIWRSGTVDAKVALKGRIIFPMKCTDAFFFVHGSALIR